MGYIKKQQNMNYQNFESYNNYAHMSPQQTAVNWSEYRGPPALLRNLQEYNQNYGQMVTHVETDVEFQRKERRRERNRKAAARGRQRQIQITNELEGKVEDLTKFNDNLSNENKNLEEEIERLKFKLSTSKSIYPIKETQFINTAATEKLSSCMSFTPLILDKNTFEFPIILSDDIIRTRHNSFAEINGLLSIL